MTAAWSQPQEKQFDFRRSGGDVPFDSGNVIGEGVGWSATQLLAVTSYKTINCDFLLWRECFNCRGKISGNQRPLATALHSSFLSNRWPKPGKW